jgi:hypothetical protein
MTKREFWAGMKISSAIHDRGLDILLFLLDCITASMSDEDLSHSVVCSFATNIPFWRKCALRYRGPYELHLVPRLMQ